MHGKWSKENYNIKKFDCIVHNLSSFEMWFDFISTPRLYGLALSTSHILCLALNADLLHYWYVPEHVTEIWHVPYLVQHFSHSRFKIFAFSFLKMASNLYPFQYFMFPRDLNLYISMSGVGIQGNPCTMTIFWCIVHPHLLYSTSSPVLLTKYSI
jgi:hypothetical protein